MQPGSADAARPQPLILFDGVCNLCERSVRFVIRHDRRGTFRFASLQSRFAQTLLSELGHADERLSSVLLVEQGRVFGKSRAALRIARQLDGAWPLFHWLFFWVPAPIADAGYDFIGKRRYRWFGKKEECWVPDDALRRRFIDD